MPACERQPSQRAQLNRGAAAGAQKTCLQAPNALRLLALLCKDNLQQALKPRGAGARCDRHTPCLDSSVSATQARARTLQNRAPIVLQPKERC